MTVVMLCGFWPHAVAEAAGALLAQHPHLRPVPHTTVRDLVTLTGDLLVTLPENCEPDEIRATWPTHGAGSGLCVTTVVPADLVLDGITDETPLRDVGLQQSDTDPRSIGDLVCRQLEQADTVLLTGEPDGDDAWEARQLRLLLRRIAPWSAHRDLGDPVPTGDGRSRPVTPVTRGLRGRTVGVHEPVPDHGVVACVFRARRPFHPGRLHEALDRLGENVIRSRGHFWLACRPDLVMTWESAGMVHIGPHSGWLDQLPLEQWGGVEVERRIAAEIDWYPYYGDRHHHLAFVGVDLDPVRLQRILAGCLLDDHDLSRGEKFWRGLPDPFRAAYPVTNARENR